jgi:hypothetical protein
MSPDEYLLNGHAALVKYVKKAKTLEVLDQVTLVTTALALQRKLLYVHLQALGHT